MDAVKEARRLAADAEEGKEMKEETCIEGVELAGPSSEGAAAAEASVDIAAPFSAAIAMEETAGNEGQLAGQNNIKKPAAAQAHMDQHRIEADSPLKAPNGIENKPWKKVQVTLDEQALVIAGDEVTIAMPSSPAVELSNAVCTTDGGAFPEEVTQGVEAGKVVPVEVVVGGAGVLENLEQSNSPTEEVEITCRCDDTAADVTTSEDTQSEKQYEIHFLNHKNA